MNVLIPAALLVGVVMSDSSAQPCFPRSQLEAYLGHDSEGKKLGWGLTRRPSSQSDVLVELFVNKEQNIWVIIETKTNGTSCIQARGTHWTTFRNLGPKA